MKRLGLLLVVCFVFVASGSYITQPPVYSPVCGGFGTCVTGTLSSAQLLGLVTSPILVIPAQGAGTLIVVDKLYAEGIFGGTPYTWTGTLIMTYASVTGSIGPNCAALLLTSSVNTVCIGSTIANFTNTKTAILNDGITFTAATPPGAPTVGNGTVNYRILYHVMTGY
jgi:hypothetical protein